jgi:hypothetical protein
MSHERHFLKDWRNMPVEHVLWNIKDLQQYHKEYMVYFTNENQIRVGDDIVITKQNNSGKYIINGFESHITNNELEYLWKLCTNTATTAEKVSHWGKWHVSDFVQAGAYTMAAAGIVALGFGINNGVKEYQQNKAEKLEQYVQKRIDEAIEKYEASKAVKYQDAVDDKKTR